MLKRLLVEPRVSTFNPLGSIADARQTIDGETSSCTVVLVRRSPGLFCASTVLEYAQNYTREAWDQWKQATKTLYKVTVLIHHTATNHG